MRGFGLLMLAVVALTGSAFSSAFADSGVQDTPLMNLFPSQRAAHQEQIDAAAFAYHDRGAAYVENLYTNQGEKLLDDDQGLLFLEGGDVSPKPVNIQEVADIIKENEAPQAAH